jgi:hypothetical protein
MDTQSPEMRELLYAIEKIGVNINAGMERDKTALNGEQFFDNRQVCKILHISSRTLQDYRDKGLIAFYRIEGKILYKMSDIQSLLEKNYFDAWKKKR